MSDDSPVTLSRGLPETVLPPPPVEWTIELDEALRAAPEQRRVSLAAVAGRYPRFIDAWAALSGEARDRVEAYAYARVGYHRGLDALRGSGWHGTGYVRWRHEQNRGLLRALEALRRSVSAIGEQDEEERCAVFLRQLDPDWPPQEFS